jgi:hypothetical protein
MRSLLIILLSINIAFAQKVVSQKRNEQGLLTRRLMQLNKNSYKLTIWDKKRNYSESVWQDGKASSLKIVRVGEGREVLEYSKPSINKTFKKFNQPLSSKMFSKKRRTVLHTNFKKIETFSIEQGREKRTSSRNYPVKIAR